MMKKMLKGILTLSLIFALLCGAALAEEIPQPEGGRKFESDWALRGGLVEIYYEEEGYRVYIDLLNNDNRTGCIWQYSCYYMEDSDTLLSISSSKTPYSLDKDTLDKVLGDAEYEGLDLDGEDTFFSIDENGKLIWTDGREGAGQDLEFQDIGRFQGVWTNAEEEVKVEFDWNGLNEEEFYYTVFLSRGGEEAYTDFVMTGLYDYETGRLEARGTATSYTLSSEGYYEMAEDDGEEYEAFFSLLDNGKLLFEAANGIELEYDILGEAGSNG